MHLFAQLQTHTILQQKSEKAKSVQTIILHFTQRYNERFSGHAIVPFVTIHMLL